MRPARTALFLFKALPVGCSFACADSLTQFPTLVRALAGYVVRAVALRTVVGYSTWLVDLIWPRWLPDGLLIPGSPHMPRWLRTFGYTLPGC